MKTNVQRPHLNVSAAAVNDVVESLATNYGERSRFLENPQGYLESRGVPVGNCQLVECASAPTAEVCTAFTTCVLVADVGYHVDAVAVNANAVMNVNISSNANYTTNVNYS